MPSINSYKSQLQINTKNRVKFTTKVEGASKDDILTKTEKKHFNHT